MKLHPFLTASIAALAACHTSVTHAQGPLPPPVSPASAPSVAPAAQPAVPTPAPTTVTGRAASAAAGGYENTVTLSASQLLQPVFMAGQLFRVRELVGNDWGICNYTIDSPLYGTFLAHGNNQLLDRITELSALQRMDVVTRTKDYADAVEDAADEEEDIADDAPDRQVDSIEDAPSSGIGKFFHRIGKDVKKGFKEGEANIYSSKTQKTGARVAAAKRDLCRKLGLNPYSSNAILQARLDGMSRVMGFAKVSFQLGAESADPVVAAVNANRGTIPPAMADLVYGKGPAEIRADNQAMLQQLGVGPVDAAGFCASPAFSPWYQTQFVVALRALMGVSGLDVLVRDAATVSTVETDAIFYAETAQLMAQLKAQQWPIARIDLHNNLPYCVLQDGSVLLALHWDYASWTDMSDKAAQWLQTLQVNGKKPTTITIAITGVASPRCRQELEKRGFRLLDRQNKGPMN
ncbi:hypothetical protein DES53_12226 [Roseimicrobium gellanilyticum]|uniref:Uncharacterized protein n=1 Tax=Roseimicrobium gellanilyticum TaxID=748857 RepID=A0A366H0I2_9BACT|nr:hypothetical protein DES53_12226 [Roseimicrobium gellanilyticum]